jgi:hypothetical protein
MLQIMVLCHWGLLIVGKYAFKQAYMNKQAYGTTMKNRYSSSGRLPMNEPNKNDELNFHTPVCVAMISQRM